MTSTRPGASNVSPASVGWSVACCFAGMMCLAICVNLPPLYLTTFSTTFGGAEGLSDEQLGRIPAVIFAALVAGICVSGPLADRWGARRFAMLGCAFSAVGLAALGVAQNYTFLLAACAVMGLGAGILDMVLSPIVSALQPHRRSAAMNWLHSFYCVGAVGTALVGAQALRAGIHWRCVVLLAALPPAAVVIGFLRMHVPALVADNAGRTPVRTLLANPTFIAAMAAIFLAGATEQGLSQWLPAYGERVLSLSKAAGGMALAGFLVAMVIGRWTSAALGQVVNAVAFMAICAGACALLYLCIGATSQAAVGVPVCVAIGFFCSCLWPTLLGVTANRFPHGGASMFALMAAAGNAGCFAMPWIVGAVAGATSLRVGVATVAACPLLLLAALRILARDGEPS